MAGNADSYEREVIFNDGISEIVRIKWPPCSKSEPHDHGVSIGLTKVTGGLVFERIYDRARRDFVIQNTYVAGDIFNEWKDMIHIMGNLSNTEWAETYHIYIPPLQMKMYPIEELCG